MAKLRDRLVAKVLGDSDVARAGADRAFRGLRQRDKRELALGLVLSGLTYLQRTKPRKSLVYRQELKEGSTVVIRNTVAGEPTLELEADDLK